MITLIIATSLIISFVVFIIKRFKSRIIIFQEKKFIVPFKDRKCPVIHFDGVGTYRNGKGKWLPENHFNLAEWTWADKYDKNFIFSILLKPCLRITNPHIIGALAFLYILIVWGAAMFIPVVLVNNLQGILGFWIIIGAAILFRELMIKRNIVAYL